MRVNSISVLILFFALIVSSAYADDTTPDYVYLNLPTVLLYQVTAIPGVYPTLPIDLSSSPSHIGVSVRIYNHGKYQIVKRSNGSEQLVIVNAMSRLEVFSATYQGREYLVSAFKALETKWLSQFRCPARLLSGSLQSKEQELYDLYLGRGYHPIQALSYIGRIKTIDDNLLAYISEQLDQNSDDYSESPPAQALASASESVPLSIFSLTLNAERLQQEQEDSLGEKIKKRYVRIILRMNANASRRNLEYLKELFDHPVVNSPENAPSLIAIVRHLYDMVISSPSPEVIWMAMRPFVEYALMIPSVGRELLQSVYENTQIGRGIAPDRFISFRRYEAYMGLVSMNGGVAGEPFLTNQQMTAWLKSKHR